jgi:hypothetical protein
MIEFLSSIQIRPVFHDWAIGELKKEYERERTDKTTILYAQHREHAKIKEMLERLFDMRLAGDIGSDRFKEEKTRLETEERRLAGHLETINARVQTWIYDAERLLTFTERAIEEFTNGSMDKKRGVFAALGDQHILKDRVLTIKTEKPLLVVQEMVSETDGGINPLEPPNSVATQGSKGKNSTTSLMLWTYIKEVRTWFATAGQVAAETIRLMDAVLKSAPRSSDGTSCPQRTKHDTSL